MFDRFEHDGKVYTNWTADELAQAGIPQAAITAEFIKARIERIKAECRRRIYAVASQEAQMNVATYAGVIREKAASNRTDEEKAVLVAASAGLSWVQAMRAAIEPLAADPESDFLADEAWPECPPEAAAVYSTL